MNPWAPKGWNVDHVLEYIKKNCPEVDLDLDAQVILCTGLYEHPNGKLYTEPYSKD